MIMAEANISAVMVTDDDKIVRVRHDKDPSKKYYQNDTEKLSM